MLSGSRQAICNSLHSDKRQAIFRKGPSKGLSNGYLEKRRQLQLSRSHLHVSEIFEVADVISIGRDLLSLGTAAGITVALAWSSLPLMRASAGAKPDRTLDEEDAGGVKWGVMSVVSFLPLFNWLAWIFAAFENNDRASFYYIMAALYGAPQLAAGFNQNWFSVATLLTGILHIQVERVAEERGVARKFTLDPDLQKKPKQATRFIEDTAQAFAEAIQSRADSRKGLDEEESKDYTVKELKEWDQRLKNKDKQ